MSCIPGRSRGLAAPCYQYCARRVPGGRVIQCRHRRAPRAPSAEEEEQRRQPQGGRPADPRCPAEGLSGKGGHWDAGRVPLPLLGCPPTPMRRAAAMIIVASDSHAGAVFSVSVSPYLAACSPPRGGSCHVPARARCGSRLPRAFCLRSNGHEA